MTTQTVQQLTLQLNASVELARTELKQLNTSLQQTDQKAAQTQDKLTGAFSNVDKAAGIAKSAVLGFVGALGVGSVIAFGRSILNFADDLGTAADQAGIGVERFQTLQEGLRALEVGSERLPAIFGRLQDALGSVQSGEAAAETVSALERLGALTGILNGEITTTEQLFDAVAAGAKGYTSEAQFLADVSALVGRKAGVELAAALRDGGVALAAQEQRFRDAGGVIAKEYITKLSAANEAIDAFSSEGQQALIIWAGSTIEQFELVGAGIAGITGPLDDAAAGFIALTGSADRELTSLVQFVQTTLEEIDAIAGVVANGPLGRLFGLEGSDFSGRFARGVERRQAERNESILNDRFAIEDFLPGGRPKAKPIVLPPSGRDGRAAGSGRQARAEDTPAQIRNTDIAFSGLDEARLALVDANAFLDEITPKLEEIRQIVPQISAPLFDQESLNITRFAIADINRGLAEAVVYGDNIGDVLVNSANRAAAAFLSKGLDSLLGAIFPGAGSLFGGFFADGGRPPMGKVSVVGERGPELFVPDMPGRIIPNGQFGGGGVTINQTIAPNFAGNAATQDDVVTMGRIVFEQTQAALAQSRATRVSPV